jgi:hypothetical protein
MMPVRDVAARPVLSAVLLASACRPATDRGYRKLALGSESDLGERAIEGPAVCVRSVQARSPRRSRISGVYGLDADESAPIVAARARS